MKDKNAPSETPAIESGGNPPRLTPGVATLLRGNNAAQEKPGSAEPQPSNGEATKPTPAKLGGAVRVSLIVADLLLLALAARLVIKAKGHLGFTEISLCVVALGLGAWLSCLAFWRD